MANHHITVNAGECERILPFRFTCDIIYSTMTRKKLDRLRRELAAARKKPQKAGDLEHLASMAGRTTYSGGKHPMWMTEFFPHRPFPIPYHGGEVSPRVRKVVLDHLEADAAAWEEVLAAREPKRPRKSNGE